MNGNLHRNHGDFTGFSLFHVVMLWSHYPQCQDAMTEVKTNLGSDLYTQGWLARHVAWISSPHLSKCPNGTYMNLYWLGYEKWETQCSKVPGAFWVDSPIICHKKINLHLSSTTTSGIFPSETNRFMQPRNPTNNQVCLRRSPTQNLPPKNCNPLNGNFPFTKPASKPAGHLHVGFHRPGLSRAFINNGQANKINSGAAKPEGIKRPEISLC